MTSTGEAVAEARAAADRVARAAGVEIVEVSELADLEEIRRIFDGVWASDPTNPTATTEVLRAYAHTGQYVAMAFDVVRPGRTALGAAVAFLSAPAGHALHSHATGVLPSGRGRAGLALKAHQRAWALDRGLDEITWTFDPLVCRNVWFNLAKLRAGVREYLVDFYGVMGDDLNARDASDRLYASWPVASPSVAQALAQGPAGLDPAAETAAGAVPVLVPGAGQRPEAAWPPPPGATTVLVGIPVDIQALREADPALARAWRTALRGVLRPALEEGWTVRGVARSGWYVLDRCRIDR